MSSSSETSPPLSLTDRQLAELAAAELIKVLRSLPVGGPIERDQLEPLRHWLFGHGGADLPVITYLTKIVVRVLGDGALSEADAMDFYLGIERILPVTERGIEREMRTLAGTAGGATVRDDWRNDPMTDAQRNYIAVVGGAAVAGTSKGDASLLIDQLLRKKAISGPQQVELRFWNQQLGAEAGPREVFEWRRKFIAEDPERQAAWDLFKLEVGDAGLQGDPMRVTLGLGRSYLARVRKGGAKAVPVPRVLRDPTGSQSGASRQMWRWLFWLGAAGAASAIGYFIFRPESAAPAPSHPIAVRKVPTVRPIPKVGPSVPTVQRVVNAPPPAPMAETKVDPDAAELVSFARTMHLSAIVTIRGQNIAMINGVHCRIGAWLGPANDYKVTEIDPPSRSVVLTDSKGNAVRRVID